MFFGKKFNENGVVNINTDAKFWGVFFRYKNDIEKFEDHYNRRIAPLAIILNSETDCCQKNKKFVWYNTNIFIIYRYAAIHREIYREIFFLKKLLSAVNISARKKVEIEQVLCVSVFILYIYIDIS